MFTHSIRWRLQLWLAFLLIVILSGFGVTAYQLHRTNQVNQIDRELAQRVDALSSALRRRVPPEFRGGRSPGDQPLRPAKESAPDRGTPPAHRGREITLPAQVLGLFDEGERSAFYFVLWSREGAVLQRSLHAPAELPLPPIRPSPSGTQTRMRDHFRESSYFNSLGECILAGRDVGTDLDALRGFAWWLFAVGGAVLALGLGGGWWLTTRAIRPVEEISAAASRISAGNLSERIAGGNPDNELGRLAGVLNSTFARLEAAFAQQTQFTADASHELRTPLAVLISETQTALARERTAAEYRETVEACLDTAQQMRRLTDSLLDLARCDAGHEAVLRAPLDLAEIARTCMERLRPLATGRGLQIHCDLAPAQAPGNADRLGQVLTNLLTNAIHYNRPGGEIRLRTRADAAGATITVADTGKGIAAEDLPHIFERFYRADKSRSRAEGRCGLGLAICRAIVEADGGRIHAQSTAGAGSEFTVTFPRERPESG